MRKITAVILSILLLFPIAAQADIRCDCGLEECSCFLQLGDIGIAVEGLCRFLVDEDYLAPDKAVEIFNEDVYQAVLRVQEDFGLPLSGLVDDDTLTCLIWGMTAAELNAADPASNAALNWIPTDGGSRMHIKPECCSMIAPRMISIRNALRLGIEPCGICNR